MPFVKERLCEWVSVRLNDTISYWEAAVLAKLRTIKFLLFFIAKRYFWLNIKPQAYILYFLQIKKLNVSNIIRLFYHKKKIPNILHSINNFSINHITSDSIFKYFYSTIFYIYFLTPSIKFINPLNIFWIYSKINSTSTRSAQLHYNIFLIYLLWCHLITWYLMFWPKTNFSGGNYKIQKKFNK